MAEDDDRILEVQSEKDAAWYDADISIQGKLLVVAFKGFDDIERISSTPEARKRVRFPSTPIEGKECKLIKGGDIVCAFYVDKTVEIYLNFKIFSIEVKHHRFGVCRCLFSGIWLDGPKAGKFSELTYKEICLISKKDINEHEVMREYFSKATPLKIHLSLNRLESAEVTGALPALSIDAKIAAEMAFRRVSAIASEDQSNEAQLPANSTPRKARPEKFQEQGNFNSRPIVVALPCADIRKSKFLDFSSETAGNSSEQSKQKNSMLQQQIACILSPQAEVLKQPKMKEAVGLTEEKKSKLKSTEQSEVDPASRKSFPFEKKRKFLKRRLNIVSDEEDEMEGASLAMNASAAVSSGRDAANKEEKNPVEDSIASKEVRKIQRLELPSLVFPTASEVVRLKRTTGVSSIDIVDLPVNKEAAGLMIALDPTKSTPEPSIRLPTDSINWVRDLWPVKDRVVIVADLVPAMTRSGLQSLMQEHCKGCHYVQIIARNFFADTVWGFALFESAASAKVAAQLCTNLSMKNGSPTVYKLWTDFRSFLGVPSFLQ